MEEYIEEETLQEAEPSEEEKPEEAEPETKEEASEELVKKKEKYPTPVLEDILEAFGEEELVKGGKLKAIIAKAKKIRKKGEAWRAAVKRAAKMLEEEKPEKKPEEEKIKKEPEEEEEKKEPYKPKVEEMQCEDLFDLLSNITTELRKRAKKEPEEEKVKKPEEEKVKKEEPKKEVEKMAKEFTRKIEELERRLNKGVKTTRQPEELAEKTGSKTEYQTHPDGSISSWDA